MATLQKFLSQLRREGLGSSSAVKSVNTSVWTSLRKSALRLPGMLQHTEDFHTRPYSTHWNKKQSGYQSGDAILLELTGDDAKHDMFEMIRANIFRSLVCLEVRRGNDTLALCPGTIIRSDGIVATSASRLSSLKSKELKATVDVKIVDSKAIYKAVLLDADFCSNIAFVNISSCQPQEVAEFERLYDPYRGFPPVAVGCDVPRSDLRYAEAALSESRFCHLVPKVEMLESHTSTTRHVMNTKIDGTASVVGGPLVIPNGVVGVIHSERRGCIQATAIDDILKYLEHFEKHGEQYPKISN